MKRMRTIILQFVTAIVFAAAGILYFLGGSHGLGILFIVLAVVYSALGIFYIKYSKQVQSHHMDEK